MADRERSAGRGAVSVEEFSAARKPHAIMSLDVIQRLRQVRRAMRRSDQEWVQRDRQDPSLIFALAIQRIESVDNVGSELRCRRALTIDQHARRSAISASGV